MAVIRSIRVVGSDGQTEIAQLNVQDGGAAAEVVILQDWRTPDELEDLARACQRMASVLRDGSVASAPEEGGA